MRRGVDYATMPGVHGGVRRVAGLLLAAAMLVAGALAPSVAAAAGGPTSLSDPSASPDAGVPSTTITLTVTYQNRAGSPPDYVRVLVNGTAYAMRATGSSDAYKKGVKFTVNIKLPVGRHPTTFEAAERGKPAGSIAGPTVTIKAPPPPPEPKPTPGSKPKPTAEARTTAVVAATAPRPAPAPVRTAPEPAHGPLPGLDPDGWSSDPIALSLIPGAFPGGGGTGPVGGGPGGGRSSLGGGPTLGGPQGPLAILAQVLPVAVVTTGAVTMVMAFLVFGKRHRDEEPTAPDDVLARAAATGLGVPNAASLIPHAPMATAVASAAAVPAAAVSALPGVPVAMPPDAEAHLPRWRRPSLLEARKADPTRTVTQGIRLTFDADAVASAPDAERRVIRYRLVSLLDLPDEVHGREIGVLDEGDEVVLVEKRGTYWRVLCPDGRQGWLHKMTLGDVVIGSSVAGGDSWTSGDNGPSGGFEDVLRAYKLRRGELPGT